MMKEYELTTQDIRMSKGYAILTMLALHLFCGQTPAGEGIGKSLIILPNGVPLLYYIGWLCAICAPTYCICSGYAHYKQGELGGLTYKRVIRRCLKFCIQYWEVFFLITATGIFLRSDLIPGTPVKFIGNLLFLSWSYNGIWWFAFVYIIYVFLSPLFYTLLNRYGYKTILSIMFLQFLFVETLQKIIPGRMENSTVLLWAWEHISYLMGARLLCYFAGMTLAKEKVFSRLNAKLESFAAYQKNLLMLSILSGGSIFLCIVGRGILLILFAVPVFVLFNLSEKCKFVRKVFLWLGGQSTYMWLLHPFLYTAIFPSVQKIFLSVEYTIGIYMALLIITGMLGTVLNRVYRMILKVSYHDGCPNKYHSCHTKKP